MNKEEFKDRLAGRFYSIEIVDDVYSRDTSEADPDDSWDRANTSTDHNITGFKAAPESENKYYDVVVPFAPLFDEPYYLLYVVYSTGDSFGHDEGSGIEYIGFYKPSQLGIAQENERKINDFTRNRNSGKYSVKLKSPEGKEFDQSAPWVGYFESMDDLEIIEVRRITNER